MLVAIDVGTSKVVALIGEVTRDGALTIIGKGAPTAAGLKKGVVINIDQTVSSIRGAIESAERLSGYKLESAFVSVGGSHVESQNSRGAVAVSGPRREVSREDVDRATEVARAVTIPSNREVLHVLPRGFVVDGQEGVKDPLGMSAIRLEVETHIVHASATAMQNLTKCVGMANVRIDELVASSLAAGERCSPTRSASWAWPWLTSGPAPPIWHSSWTVRRCTRRCCPSAATTSPMTWPSASRPTSWRPRR